MNPITVIRLLKGAKNIKNLRLALMTLNVVSVSADIYIKLHAIQKEKKKESEDKKKES